MPTRNAKSGVHAQHSISRKGVLARKLRLREAVIVDTLRCVLCHAFGAFVSLQNCRRSSLVVKGTLGGTFRSSYGPSNVSISECARDLRRPGSGQS